MNSTLISVALISLIISISFLLLALKFFPRLGLMDRPHEYGLKRSPVPYSAGIIFYIIFLITVFSFVDVTRQIAGLIFALSLIVIVSFIDDRMRLSPFLRLGAQILSAVIVVLAGVKIQIITNPFGSPIYLDSVTLNILGQSVWLFSALAIIAWFVLIMNVFNWLDGISGLASGVSAIAMFAIFLLANGQFNIVDQSAVKAPAIALAVSALVFFFFEFPMPRLLMGDTGSMALGFMLAALSIISGGKFATALLIMGVPVLDAVLVIVRRIIAGASPLKGDYSHLHHRVLALGMSTRASLGMNLAICAACASIALLLDTSAAKFIAFICVAAALSIMEIALAIKKKRV